MLTRKAAEQPKARAIYDQGVASGQSFEQIELAMNCDAIHLFDPDTEQRLPG